LVACSRTAPINLDSETLRLVQVWITDSAAAENNSAALKQWHHRHPTIQSLNEEFNMKSITAALMSIGLLLAGSNALAQDAMKKTAMSMDGVKKDAMAKDGMKKDAMAKDGMKKDNMAKDGMKKDAMDSGEMKK
jgi:pentapeptide MXKDX repeat protein